MLKRTTILGAAAAALALAAPASASAQHFDLLTGKSATPGQARGVGDVTFLGPRRVKVVGKINDICPKDGYGAYIEFKFNFRGGGYATRRFSDQQTCQASAVRFAFTSPDFGKFVKTVGVTVIELDQRPGGGFVPGDAARKLITR